MKSSQNTLWVAGAGVLAVLLVVFTYLFVIAPQRTEAADLATQRVSVQDNNAAIQQKTAQLASEFETLPQKRVELAQIEATLPAQAEVPALLRSLEAYSTSAGVTVTQIAPGEPTPFGGDTATKSAVPTGIVQIPLTLTVSGSFPQVELYLKNLQVDLPRHLLVQGVTVATETTGTASGVTATITGSIFVIQDESTAAATTGGTAAAATGSTDTTTTTTTPTTTTPTTSTTGAVS